VTCGRIFCRIRFTVEFRPAVAKLVRVPSAHTASLPDLSPDRLLDRVAEAMLVAKDSRRGGKLPPWTRRVMRILKDQFIPSEFASILAGDGSIFAEGIAVAWSAKARDIAQTRESGETPFARELARRLRLDQHSREVAEQVEAGTFLSTAEFQAHVLKRLFATDHAERRAFVEGLAIGNRLPELLDRQASRSTTDATAIYLLLWFYWPEIARLGSIPELASALEPFFAENRNLLGSRWEERIRKLANRIGLSYRRAQQRRTRTVSAKK
jgi:hypothetical protein